MFAKVREGSRRFEKMAEGTKGRMFETVRECSGMFRNIVRECSGMFENVREERAREDRVGRREADGDRGCSQLKSSLTAPDQCPFGDAALRASSEEQGRPSHLKSLSVSSTLHESDDFRCGVRLRCAVTGSARVDKGSRCNRFQWQRFQSLQVEVPWRGRLKCPSADITYTR